MTGANFSNDQLIIHPKLVRNFDEYVSCAFLVILSHKNLCGLSDLGCPFCLSCD